MRLGTRQECVGSSSWVSGVCQDSAREFARRRPRLAERLSGVVEKIAGNNGPRSSLGIGPSLDDAVGFRREFARRFTEGIEKLLGTRQEITGRRPKDLLQVCRRLPDCQKLCLNLACSH
ncbi:hypothetical protein B296_00004019 [Ensete ventricosum]|uniref:Uncharacterized protein n=1 Tax=Ensete ventricosum TaxID=4639 RepID=A0A426Z7Q5_ENSVE|nr:hypothetical protein B296_00004019 [Ensete ventricosum]